IKAASGETDHATALRVHWGRQIDGTVYSVLRDELRAALDAKTIFDLKARISSRVAPELLNERVLSLCLEDCPTDHIPTDTTAFLESYLDHLLNATVHAMASRPNPAGKAWAAFLASAWNEANAAKKKNTDDTAAGADWLLPSAASAPSLVRFEDLWDVRAPRLN